MLLLKKFEIILFMFNIFLEQTKDIWENELPVMLIPENSEEERKIGKIWVSQFLELNDPYIEHLLKNELKVESMFHKSKKNIQRKRDWIDSSIKILENILDKTVELFAWKSDHLFIITVYLILFRKWIGDFFYDSVIDIFSWKIKFDTNIVNSYLFLEGFLGEHLKYSSITYKIAFSNNFNVLLLYWEQKLKKEKVIPSIDEIEIFLNKQLKSDCSGLNDRSVTHNRNNLNYHFNPSQQIFDILTLADDYQELEPLWWCPFAKSKTCEWDNALITMFQTFDEYSLRIFKELKKQWYMD